MATDPSDARFDRAVGIVHSLPKSGPIQTSYEEKLHLYSLYKQATDGDIATSRPGLLDMLGRAKWDSWNKQKGKLKEEARREYVAALLKILKKYPDDLNSQAHVSELEGSTPAGSGIIRAVSPSSSTTSSYHSSQAPSPPPSPPPLAAQPQPAFTAYPLPDPTLPPPDVSPDIVPPSALNASHRSLLNLQDPQAGPSDYAHSAPVARPVGSRAHSLAGPGGGSDAGFFPPRNPSVHSFRRNPPSGQVPTGLGFLQDNQLPRGARSPVVGRDFMMTPEIPLPSPYAGIHQPTPLFPRPGSASTFATIPPVNVPATLQQIQLSLTALHERLSTLERTSAILVRREERKRGWFWGSSEEDELEALEEEAERDRWIGRFNTRTGVRIRRGMPARLVWWLITAVRRAMIDVGVGMLVVILGMVVVSGGYRRGRGLVNRWKERLRDFLRDLAS